MSFFAPVSLGVQLEGWITRRSANQPAAPVANALVKFCSSPTCGPGSYELTAMTNYNGYYHTYDSFHATPGSKLYMFVTGPESYWGSSQVPYGEVNACPYKDQWGNCVNSIFIRVYANEYPSPLPPNALNPTNGASNVWLDDLTLSWTDGLDSARRSPYWPATYDIYAAGRPYGYWGPMTKIYSDIPCGGSGGSCSVTVPGSLLKPDTPYRWYVVAKLKVDPYKPLVFTTSSNMFFFSTGCCPSY
jgi:hypothetical protein